MTERRSFFFPLALIAAGALWLLINVGSLPAANLWALAYIWPYFLIAMGVGLILRGYLPAAAFLVSLLVVAGAVLAVLYAPTLGWAQAPEWGFGWWDVNGGGAVRGSANLVTEARDLSEITSITIRYPSEITIKQGDVQSVEITADDNLLRQLSTQVRSGELVLENSERSWSKRVNPSESVKVTITVNDLKQIDFDSAGKVVVEQLSTDRLELNLSGASDITLSNLALRNLTVDLSGAGSIRADGSVEELNLKLDGLGSFNGNDLFAQQADINLNGAGSATVHVEQDLTATINGAGSINYYGSPQVHSDVNGLGSVKKVGD
jgi:hypothetical protein